MSSDSLFSLSYGTDPGPHEPVESLLTTSLLLSEILLIGRFILYIWGTKTLCVYASITLYIPILETRSYTLKIKYKICCYLWPKFSKATDFLYLSGRSIGDSFFL